MILIPGASGEAEVFRQAAPTLSEGYQVVIYDRRGFSRSLLDGPQDYDHRLQTDAEDVRCLIEHLTDQPAVVFGNSSGAIVALEVLTCYPELVRNAIAHEPPVVNLLPDGAKWLAYFDEVYATYRQSGVPRAIHQFASGTGAADHKLLQRFLQGPSRERFLANAAYWMEHELRQYPRVDLDLAALAARCRQLVLAGGHDSIDLMTSQPNRVLAGKLGLEVIDFPGGHLGFLAYPDEFARELIHVLNPSA